MRCFIIDGPFVVPGIPVQINSARPWIKVGKDLFMVVSDEYLLGELPLARVMRADLTIIDKYFKKQFWIHPETDPSDSRALIVFDSRVVSANTWMTIDHASIHERIHAQKHDLSPELGSESERFHSLHAICTLEPGESLRFMGLSRKRTRVEPNPRWPGFTRRFLPDRFSIDHEEVEMERYTWTGKIIENKNSEF